MYGVCPARSAFTFACAFAYGPRAWFAFAVAFHLRLLGALLSFTRLFTRLYGDKRVE